VSGGKKRGYRRAGNRAVFNWERVLARAYKCILGLRGGAVQRY
jgi:hypothetical protein